MRTPVVFLFLLFLSPSVFSQASDSRLSGLETEIKNLMEVYNTVGLSVAIVENDKVVYMNGFGYGDLEKKQIVTPSTSFLIGSITKQFTSSLIGIYEEEEKLSLQDRPVNHINGLEFYSDEMNSLITIEDLLAHHSGIGNLDGTGVFFPPDNAKEFFERLKYLTPNSSVRERFDYSNMGYAILGEIGARITNQSWEENIKGDIFAPLEMNSSTASLDDFLNRKNASAGYSISNGIPIKVLPEDLHMVAPAGAIGSTAEDMTKWVQTLLNGGEYNNDQVLPESYLEQAFSSHSVIRSTFDFDENSDMQFDTYGYGWAVHSLKKKYKVSHSGSVSGFTAHMEMYPFEDLGIVILTNQHLSGIIRNISDIIANRMLAFERQDWDEYKVNVPEGRVFDTSVPPTNTNQPPSVPLDQFVGSYNHKGYGTLTISLEEGVLFVTLPAFKMALFHEGNNNFRTKSLKDIHQNSPNFLYRFMNTKDGKISEIVIGFQTEPVIFRKIEG